MKFTFRIFVCIITFLSLSGCKNYRVIEPDYDRSFTDSLVESTDEPTKAAQLPILRELPMDDERSEIRIWIGFGPMILQGFYSLNLTNGISGQKIWYFKPPWKQWNDQDYDEFTEELYVFCDKMGSYNEYEACDDTEFHDVDWVSMYEELNELGIWSFPDSSELPRFVENNYITTVDGTSVLVEIKKPGFYRSYSHPYEYRPIKEEHLYGNKILEVITKYTK